MARHTSIIKLLIKTAYNGQGKENRERERKFIANYVCFMQISLNNARNFQHENAATQKSRVLR